MGAALIAGIITAVVGATAGMIQSLVDDDKARKDAAQSLDYVNQEYNLKKAEADLEFNQAKEEAQRNADKLNEQADLTDLSQDVAEKTLANDFNTTIDNLYLSQEQDTLGWNTSAMQSGSSEGSAYANIAGSGVRAGSSMSDAVLMESAVNSSMLQFAQDSKRRSDNNNLASVLNGLAGNEIGIMANRIDADRKREDALNLVNSYLKGGTNYELYKNNLAQLGNWQAQQSNKLHQQYAEHSGWSAFGNAFLALHTGGAQGFQTGYQVGDTVTKATKYKSTVGGGD